MTPNHRPDLAVILFARLVTPALLPRSFTAPDYCFPSDGDEPPRFPPLPHRHMTSHQSTEPGVWEEEEQKKWCTCMSPDGSWEERRASLNLPERNVVHLWTASCLRESCASAGFLSCSPVLLTEEHLVTRTSSSPSVVPCFTLKMSE